MRFLIVGLGSMGKRRARNLLALGQTDIIGFDPRADRRQEVAQLYGIRVVDQFQEGMDTDPDVLIICAPPDLHSEYALLAVRKGRHYFSEIGIPDDRLLMLEKECRERGVVGAPSCTMRYHPAIRKAKAVLDSGEIGAVLAFTHHFGEHLTRWHPWEDYRDFYVSRRHTGACREIVTFELIWLTWLCGDVEAISAFKGKICDLGTDIDDVYQVILKFRSGCLGHLQVDALQRAGYRQSRFVCEKGVISWDWDAHRLMVFGADGSWREYPDTHTQTSVEGFYIDEMAAFLKAVRGEQAWPFPLSQSRCVLDLLCAAERSAESGRHVSVKR